MADKQYPDDEIDLIDYIRIMIKRKKIILTIFLLCVITATIISFLMPKVYETSAIIEIGSIATPASGSMPISASTLLISKDEAIQKIQAKKILNSAIQKLNLTANESMLIKMIKTEDVIKTNLIKLKIQHANPDLAVKICNAIAHSFIQQSKESQNKKLSFVKEEIDRLEKRNKIIEKEMGNNNKLIQSQAVNSNFSLMQNTLSNYEAILLELNEKIYSLRKELIDLRQFEIWEPAVTAQNIKPNKKLNIAISAVLGLMIGILVAFFQEFWEKVK